MEFHQILQHIHMYMANTTNKKIRARGQYFLELFPFVILNGFLYRQFPLYLKELLMEFHQTLQTHPYLQDEYL